MKRFRSTPLAIASALIVAASMRARPRYGGTLRIETDAALRSIDPAAAPADAGDAIARNRVLPLIFETLAAPDPSGGLRPQLAVSWQSDARTTRWRFHLRSGVRLHDGSALDRTQLAAALTARNAAWRVTATDDGVAIESDEAMPSLPWELADVRYAVAFRRSNGELVGTGPFRAQRLEGGRLSLRAHEDYWGGRPFVDSVEIASGRSGDELLAALELGRADMVNVRPTDARRLDQRGFRILTSQPVQLVALTFDEAHVSSADDRMRASLALAVDRPAICGVLLQRRCEPALTLLPEWLSGYASLLASHGDGLTRRSVSTPPTAVTPAAPRQRTLSLRIESADPVVRLLAERIVVDARETGVTLAIEPPGLAPRPDLRLMSLRLPATTPERALESVVDELARRGVRAPARSAEPLPGSGAPLEATYRFERALIEAHVIVPIVFLPELYGVSPRFESWERPLILPSGSWDLAGAWAP